MANGIRKLDKNKISGSGIKRRLDPDKIHVDTAYVYKLQNDVSEKRLRRLNESLEKIRSGWQDKETMEKTRKELSSVRESIDRYNNFLSLSGSKNGNDRLNALSNAYGQMLEDFDSYASTYREAEDYVRGQKSKFVGAAREEYVAKASADLVKEWQKEAKAYYDKWGHLAEEADFDEYVKKGEATKKKPNAILQNVPLIFQNDEQLKNIAKNTGIAEDDFMTDDERNIYNYLLGKDDAKRAEQYLEDIQDTRNYRAGMDAAEKIQGIDNTFLRALTQAGYSVYAGLDQFTAGTAQTFSDKHLSSNMAYTNQELAQDLDGIAKYAYQAGNTIGNMLPSIAISAMTGGTAGQILGAGTMGVSAGGNAYGQALAEGYSQDQARAYGVLVGASEGGLQYLLGGIGKLGGKVGVGKIAEKAAQIDNALLRVSAKLGGSILDETIEEELQNFLEPAFRTILFGEDYDAPTVEEIIETAIVTALSTGVLEGGGTISNDIRETALQNARLDMRYSGQEDAFNAALTQVLGQERAAEMLEGTYLPSKKEVETARGLAEADSAQTSETLNEYARALAQDESEVNPESRELKRLQQSIDSGDLSGRQIDRMVNQRENRWNVQDAAAPALHDKEVIQAAAENRLAELGETYDAAAIAEAVARQVAGERLTRQERRTLEDSEYGVRVANEMDPANVGTGEYSNAYVEDLEPTQFYNRQEEGLRTGTFLRRNAENPAETSSPSVENTLEYPNVQPVRKSANMPGIPRDLDVSATGQDILTETGETIDIKEISSIKNGVMKLRLQNGEEVDSRDVSYASADEAMLYEIALNMGTNAAVANALIQNYHSEDGVSADIYAFGAEEAYRYGRYGIPAEEMSARGFSAVLTQAQRAFAYGLGQSDRRSIAEQEQAEVQKKKAAASKKGRAVREKRGKVTFEKGVQAVTERQKVSVAALEKVAEVLGVDFHLFESEADAEGRRVGANGWYENGSIYLDIHAGVKGEDTILFTAAHELTHFIREWSPAKFKTFADFLFAEYGKKGVSVDALIEKQIQKAKETGRSISYGTAYEEVVADSCETMLADGRAVEKLARLKAQDKSLWEKVRDFIRELAAKIRAVYEGLSPDSPEGRYVAQMKDAADRLQDMFTEALADAGEVYQAAGKGSVAGDQSMQNGTKKGNLATPEGEQAPPNTPEASRGTVSNNSIRNKSKNVKENSEKKYSVRDSDDSYIEAVERRDFAIVQEMVDEAAKAAGYTIKAYHGTSRGDRVGNIFRADRATSGPMAFFTDSLDIASNYARDKADTSIAYDEEYDSYYTQFRVNRNGKNISVPELWKYLSPSEKSAIKEKAKHIKFDDEAETIIVDNQAEHGNGAWDAYTLNMHRGNALEALIDTWLESGDLYNQEDTFLEVLKLVGVTDVEYYDPNARFEKVYDVWLKIQNPFDTENIDQSFYDGLSKWIDSIDMSVYERETANADMWDKNNQTSESWLEKLSDDIENGTTHAWTVIPDFVTDYLKEQGYDGIKDTGGKNGGETHTVWIPFHSEQIKSAEPVTYDDNGRIIPLSERFHSGKTDIRYSMRDYSYEALTEKPDMQVTILSEDVPKNRADVVFLAKKNAAKIGKRNKDGSVTVHVKDIDRDVVIGTRGLQHGLDRRFNTNAPVALQAGEILQNSIQINEMNPEKAEADSSYVLIGAAQSKNGQLYIVRSVVNGYRSELASMDVLYAMNAKTEADLQIQKENRLGDYPRGGQHKGSSPSGSTISISELLDSVNRYFPDILPEDVLRHYGHTERPEGRLGESALYSMRDPQQVAEWEEVREILTEENRKLREDNENLQQLVELQQKVAHGTKITKSSVEVAAKALKKEANATGNTAQLSALLTEFYGHISDGIDLSSENAAQAVRPVVDWLISNSKAESAVLSPELERQKLIAEVYDSYWRVSTLQEAAQPIQRDINRLKMKHRESMERLRDRHKKSMDKLRRDMQEKARESRQKGIESRSKTAMRAKIKRVASELNRLLLNGTKEKNVKQELQYIVASILDLVNMDTVSADRRVAEYNQKIAQEMDPEKRAALIKSRNYIQDMGDRIGERLQDFKEKYAQLKESENPEQAALYDEVVETLAGSVQEFVGDTALRDMSLEQLRAVYDLFCAARTVVHNTNRIFKEKGEARIEELQKTISGEIEAVAKAKEWEDKRGTGIKQFFWDELIPIYAFRRIGSDTLQKEVYDRLINGQDGAARDLAADREFLESTREKYGWHTWDKEERHTFRSVSGRSFSFNLEERMELYVISNRPQGLKHLLSPKGGFGFKEGETNGSKKKRNKTFYTLDESTIKEICDTLTEEQKAFANALQQYLAEVIGPRLNEVSMRTYGIEMYNEDTYWPLSVDRVYAEMLEKMEKGNWQARNISFSNALNSNANGPILIGGLSETWGKHIHDASTYHNLVLPLENFRKLISRADSPVRWALDAGFGTGPVAYLEKLYQDMNGGIRGERDSMKMIDNMIGKAKKGAVLASASVAIQQPSAILRATALINPIYFVTSAPTAMNFAIHEREWEECKKYAPTAQIKEMGHFDMGMGRSTVDWLLADKPKGLKEKAAAFAKLKDSSYRDEILSKMPGLADELTWVYIWEAVKRETKARRKDLVPGSEEFLQAAGKRFTEVINRTQVYDSTLSRSGHMRNKSQLAKMSTAFMAEPTVQANMLMDAAIQARRAGVKEGLKVFSRTSVSIVSSVLLNAVLKSIVTAARDDDEEKTYFEKYIGEIAGNFLSDVNPLTSIPFVRDAWSIRQGYSVDRLDMDIVSDLVRAIQAMDSDSKSDGEKISGVIGAAANLFGIPAKNIDRDIRALLNVMHSFGSGNKTTKAGIEMAIDEATSKNRYTNAEQIYTYYSSGEVSEVTYMVDDMMQKGLGSGKTEDEARSSIRSSMTSLLKPMYLVAYIAKDEDEMKKIRMLMQKTGVYGTVGDIIGDCKKWIKDLEDEEKTKKAIDKVKEGDLYESDIDVEKAYGKLLKSLAS